MKKIASVAAISAITLSMVCLAQAAEQTPQKLEVTPQTKKLEVRHSQIGYRSTLLFYTFAEQKTVLKLLIGNRDKTFPVTAEIYVFDAEVTPRGISKWLNNQHSDGIYPEVPEPAKVVKLPKKNAAVKTHKLINQSELPFGAYDNYAVTFEVAGYKGDGIELSGFKGETKVHVKAK